MFLEHRKEQSDNHQSETVNEVICQSSENGGNEKKERDSLGGKEEEEEEKEEEEEGEESEEDSDGSEEMESEDEEGNTFKVFTTIKMKPYTHMSSILQSACAVCINAGSLSDPPDIPGLAHLLEHSMVL